MVTGKFSVQNQWRLNKKGYSIPSTLKQERISSKKLSQDHYRSRTSTTNGNGKRSRAQTSTNILNLDAAVVINNDKADSDGFSILSKLKNLSRSDLSSSIVSKVDNAVNPFQVLAKHP